MTKDTTKCLHCNKGFEAIRKDALYCSSKCNKAQQRVKLSKTKQVELSGTTPYEIIRDKQVYKRQGVRYKEDKYGSRPMPDNKEDKPDPQNRCIYQRQDKTLYVIDVSGQSIDFQDNPMKEHKAYELYQAIDNYEGDTWKDSNEFKELMRRLKAMPIKVLESQGYKIPNWKFKEEYQTTKK